MSSSGKSVLDRVLEMQKQTSKTAQYTPADTPVSLTKPCQLKEPESMLRTVLSWNFHAIDAKNITPSGAPLEICFPSHSAYREAFKELLVLECFAQLELAKSPVSNDLLSEGFNINVLGASPTTNNLISCDAVCLAQTELCDNDVLYLSTQRHACGGQALLDEIQDDKCHSLALVHVKRIREREGPGQLVTLTMYLPINRERPKKLRDRLVPHQVLFGMRVTTFSTMLREYSAVLSLPAFPLSDHVLSASPLHPIPSTSPQLPKSLDFLRASYNDVQLDAIVRCCSGTQRGIRMIQGPPGTGKTHVILGLLAALLRLSNQRDASAIMPGKSLASRSQANTAPFKRKRILVCAPSNAAVDEIAVRLVRGLMPQPSDPTHRLIPNLVRIPARGSTSVAPEIRKIVLDNLVSSSVGDLGVKGLWQRRISIIQGADICLCTLSTTGSRNFEDAGTMFDVVIIDEAGQSTEPTTLIPLRYCSWRCILVGDPKQLPATVLSAHASRRGLGRSLFERLQSLHHPTFLLTHQYRMRPEISCLSSNLFYDGLLVNSGRTITPAADRPHHADPFLKPFVLVNVDSPPTSDVYFNTSEAVAVVDILLRLRRYYSNEMQLEGKVGVITPYRRQLSLLRDKIHAEIGGSWARWIELNTVDSFQGREKDVIILSSVRADAKEGIGFVANKNRLNVAITRAMSSLIIVGSVATLSQFRHWNALIKHAESVKALVEFSELDEGVKHPSDGSGKGRAKRERSPSGQEARAPTAKRQRKSDEKSSSDQQPDS
eukprot:c19503_g1_i4.p1 GENE.c19503_g1_i4~~c19503_g1_i4.p1  ORF type:complete len:774 (-),score=164.69 c19503_g1_i4:67-2388(-)